MLFWSGCSRKSVPQLLSGIYRLPGWRIYPNLSKNENPMSRMIVCGLKVLNRFSTGQRSQTQNDFSCIGSEAARLYSLVAWLHFSIFPQKKSVFSRETISDLYCPHCIYRQSIISIVGNLPDSLWIMVGKFFSLADSNSPWFSKFFFQLLVYLRFSWILARRLIYIYDLQIFRARGPVRTDDRRNVYPTGEYQGLLERIYGSR